MIRGEYETIAMIHNDYVSKFGIPRQSGLVEETGSVIVFEPEYRNREAVRGLELYNYVWLIWLFSENIDKCYRPTVRPPRLGGNTRIGVYATRSPFRPNHIGLSSVRLLKIDVDSKDGPLIYVSGADLMDGTPILDIKPYLAYTDMHQDAVGGFSNDRDNNLLCIGSGLDLLGIMPDEKAMALIKILEQDPRPAYHEDSDRIYSFEYAGYHIEFCVDNNVISVLTVR